MGGGGEAELAVGGVAFAGHGDEHSDVGVVVVVYGDVGLGGVGAQEPADVLDDAALERHREGEHEGVEVVFACDQHAMVVLDQRVQRRPLLRSQVAVEPELERLGDNPAVGQLQRGTRPLDDLSGLVEQTARYLQPIERFAVTADDPRRVPGREAHPLLLEERSIQTFVPVDVLITDPTEMAERRDDVGSVLYWPLREGRSVYRRPNAEAV